MGRKLNFCLIFVIFIVVLFSGCTSSSNDSVKVINPNEIMTEIANYRTNSTTFDSDNDRNPDGIILNPILMDSNGKTISVSGISIPMDIEIRNTQTEKGSVIPSHITDQLYKGKSTVTSSPNQKIIINLKEIDFNNIETYKDTYGVYMFAIDSKLYISNGRILEYQELVPITLWGKY